jgi:CBS domain-containing protein
MEQIVRDIMSTDFDTVRPDASVKEAVQVIAEAKAKESGYRRFSVLVTDELDQLVGIVSVFDVLYHLRPPFLNYEVDSFPIWEGELQAYIEQFKNLKVYQIMSSPVMTISPDDPVMLAIDRMVKKKARRVPVVKEDEIVGVVYLTDLFQHLCKTWLKMETV